MFEFKIHKKSNQTKARLGEINTPHGKIKTPVFMPVGTTATVKAIRQDDLENLGAEIILGNTYHLHLRPGSDLIKKTGGLHQFMSWQKPMLTDSGGFQVFSLGKNPDDRQIPKDDANASKRNTKLAKVTDEGVHFQSHIDGQNYFMGPRESIAIQENLGADIIMVFDECTPYPITYDEALKSMQRSLKWEAVSLESKTRDDQALFCILQGGMYVDLRKKCLEELLEISQKSKQKNGKQFEGYAIGGLSVGEPMPLMYEMVDQIASLMPHDKPRYLMGVGMPQDLITCIDLGIDMFDCVIPTRNARNGMLFTESGSISIKQAQFENDTKPIDENCSCLVCRRYSRAYLRHLHLSKEILSSILSSIHNLHYYLNLINRVRFSLEEERFPEFKKEFFSKLKEE